MLLSLGWIRVCVCASCVFVAMCAGLPAVCVDLHTHTRQHRRHFNYFTYILELSQAACTQACSRAPPPHTRHARIRSSCFYLSHDLTYCARSSAHTYGGFVYDAYSMRGDMRFRENHKIQWPEPAAGGGICAFEI